MRIEMKDLPGYPGTVAYEISGDTAEIVQAQITRIMNKISETGGVAEFRNPYRAGAQWFTRGYVTT